MSSGPSERDDAGATDAKQRASATAQAPAERSREAALGAAAKPGSGPGWLATAASKVPTTWLTGALVGVFLVATAAFGGLEPVEAAPPAELAAGAPHEGTVVDLTVERAVLIDTFAEAGARAGEGQRVLAVVVEAENAWDRELRTLTDSFQEMLRLEGAAEGGSESVARIDDGTLGPRLQPGVAAPLVITWLVPADAYAEGDSVRIELYDHEIAVGQSVTYGEYLWDPQLAAVVTVELEDVGAGADAETDADSAGGAQP